MDASFEFPKAQANDPSDVAVALETAMALWRRGDSREALRWLRRAAEGAESEGDDLRAVALARAAADLQDRLPQTPSMPAPPPSQPPSRSRQPPPFSPTATPTPSQVRTSTPPPPPSQRAVPNAGGLEPWTPPASRPPPSSPRASGPPPLPQTEQPQREPAKAAPPAAKEAPARQEALQAAPAEDGATPKARSAVRVSVELLSKKSGTLLVRLLGENDPPTANAHEALLVPVEPGVDFRDL